MRRFVLTATLAAGLFACAPKPPDFGYAYSGAPLWGALTTAQQNMSNMGQYRGNPAGAALALAQYQFILSQIGGGGDGAGIPLASQGVIQGGDVEIRSALGVAPGVPHRVLAQALQSFGQNYQVGQSQAALAALSPSIFPAGPQATLATLGNLPPLRSVENASYALTRAAGNITAR
jgi:hypothetical protein